MTSTRGAHRGSRTDPKPQRNAGAVDRKSHYLDDVRALLLVVFDGVLNRYAADVSDIARINHTLPTRRSDAPDPSAVGWLIDFVLGDSAFSEVGRLAVCRRSRVSHWSV